MKKNELLILDNEYIAWIAQIKEKVKQAQIKAAIKVNYELLNLYWELGREIANKEKFSTWGDKFLLAMSRDLKQEFPDVSGFSLANLQNIRYWYKFYGTSLTPEIENLIKSIPWGHNQRIMYKCKSVDEALFYVRKTLDNGWSRSVLEHQIESTAICATRKGYHKF